MMAKLQANHQIINISIFGKSKLLLYPVLITTSNLQQQKCLTLRSRLLKIECNVSDNSSSALVQQCVPDTNEDLEMMMIDQTVEIESRRKTGVYDDEFDDNRELDYLVKEYGWNVRRMVEVNGEMRKVALIQAQAFYDPAPFFDDWFFQFFKAEVLAGLIYRLGNSPPDRYACLVAEPAKEYDKDTSIKSQPQEDQLVGVVDVTVLRDNDVLQHLDGAEEYLYVSGIAVSNDFRRQKVATVLLKACEVIAVLWGYEYLVLRAYEDDWGARSLYTNAGYKLVWRDPLWVTWIGRKRRILMTKRCC